MVGILEGKVAIITGASQGIGATTSELFVKEGASVVITARRKEVLDKQVEKLKSMGGKVIGIVADAASVENCKNVFEQTVKEFGQIDIVVNNAGTLNMLHIDSTSDELWKSVLDINASSVFYYCREALKYMLPKNSGRIINIGSTNGIRPLTGFSYSVSKSLAHAITRSVALRLTGTNITCNAVCPGSTQTAMTDAFNAGEIPADDHSMKIVGAKVDFSITPSDPIKPASTILFLASDAGSDLNGNIIEVDKGAFI